jgi:cysteine desulfurase / selenocysteine lyase
MDVKRIREDFPVLGTKSGGKQLVYLDSACTSLKPKQVIDAVSGYYSEYSACAGRSTHRLSVRATETFEQAREKVAKFVHARKPSEIIWTKNSTEAMNLVSHGFRFEKGDRVLTTNLEHSSGLLPWHELASEGTIGIDFVLCSKEGEFDLADFSERISKRTKLVSIIHTSNVIGTTSPIKEIAKIAHDNGAMVLVDAAQSVPHFPIDVRSMDADFLAFSGHKMCGPTGSGCLYGKEHTLKELRPFIIGGGTIIDADLNSHKLENIPQRLEGGIQDYAGAIGLGAAVDYLSRIGMNNIAAHERELSKILARSLMEIPNLELIGPKDLGKRGSLASFSIKGMEPHDIAAFMDDYNIAIRSGMHCAYPFHKYIGRPRGSARASLYLYNTEDEVKRFTERLGEVVDTLV